MKASHTFWLSIILLVNIVLLVVTCSNEPSHQIEKTISELRSDSLLNNDKTQRNSIEILNKIDPSLAQLGKPDYPSVILYPHSIKKGEDINSIANMYGNTIDQLFYINETRDSSLKFVRDFSVAIQCIHLVRKNELLSKIAEKYNVSVRSILKANNLRDPDLIVAGRSIIIPLPKKNE